MSKIKLLGSFQLATLKTQYEKNGNNNEISDGVSVLPDVY